MYLPPPVRRRLDARLDRAREEGFRAGLAHAAERRSRERFRYVFVVTYGRSGSTLVQGLLNAFPRVLVRGENDLYLLDLYRALARLRAFRELHGEQGSRNVVSAFYGLKAIRRSAFMQAMNDVVTTGVVGNLDADDYDVLGFKEVVWHRIDPDETAAFFDTMDKAFPGVRYVLNTRDVERVLGSGFWRDADADEARRAHRPGGRGPGAPARHPSRPGPRRALRGADRARPGGARRRRTTPGGVRHRLAGLAGGARRGAGGAGHGTRPVPLRAAGRGRADRRLG